MVLFTYRASVITSNTPRKSQETFVLYFSWRSSQIVLPFAKLLKISKPRTGVDPIIMFSLSTEEDEMSCLFENVILLCFHFVSLSYAVL